MKLRTFLFLIIALLTGCTSKTEDLRECFEAWRGYATMKEAQVKTEDFALKVQYQGAMDRASAWAKAVCKS